MPDVRTSPCHLHAFNRATLVWEEAGWAYPTIDGERVTVSEYESFLHDWSLWYEPQQHLLRHSCTALCIFATAAEMVSLGAQIPGCS